jgi:hypothetical protein
VCVCVCVIFPAFTSWKQRIKTKDWSLLHGLLYNYNATKEIVMVDKSRDF